MWVGLISQRPEKNKMADRLREREFFPAWVPLTWDTGFFPTFGLRRKQWLFLGLQPAGLQTGTAASVLLGFQLADLLADLGTCQPT